MRNRLHSITIKGFKTICCLKDFQPGQLTVMIGPNGAGKSNFISCFNMLNWALGDSGNLQRYIGLQGGASVLLHDGPSKTREIDIEISIATDSGDNQYSFTLAYAASDTFIYTEEKYRYSSKAYPNPANWNQLGAGHRESQLIQRAEGGEKTAVVILSLLKKLIVHQFHDTSATARMRGKWDKEDNRRLKQDAANIAPFLIRLKENEPKHYTRIVETIRLILPFFADFELEPDNGKLLLKWREKNSDRVFNAAQAADGMLRVMAMVTLLLQPENDLPDVLILDEPELGLHPYAIDIITGLIRGLSTKIQVIIATQSPALIDCFEPDDIVVVERRVRESTFRRLGHVALQEWLQEYSLSDLWHKNVIGGQPS